MSIILVLTYIVLPDNFIMNLFIYFYLIFILVDNISTDTAKIWTEVSKGLLGPGKQTVETLFGLEI